eukprot:CAMPEP_0176285370 /NCGR_PEP_ID=MMETSP0121_2-20121125/52331_1 /TAXON_ID=160619 /ORGANISM="Kryptoperidinium foliaceum, Strain CCMP 1326" /LENGTH=96 /DNA_ID=CAMNT_0017625845 /DNA_START=26 /DNA_END=314 /DNA_ORIENTATION=-
MAAACTGVPSHKTTAAPAWKTADVQVFNAQAERAAWNACSHEPPDVLPQNIQASELCGGVCTSSAHHLEEQTSHPAHEALHGDLRRLDQGPPHRRR